MEIKLSQAIIIQAAFDILAETQALSQLSMRNIANKFMFKHLLYIGISKTNNSSCKNG